MGVMTQPRTESDSSQQEKRLEDKLSSATAAVESAAKMKEMTTMEESGFKDIEGGILDVNANVEITKEARPENSEQDCEQAEEHVKAKMIDRADVSPKNDVMDDVKLKKLAGEVADDADADEKEGKEGDEDGEEGENEEGEEEEEPPEMTPEEKQAMRDAVKDGNIDLLEDLLDKPDSDINMVYFQENLLMTAIRAGQGPMAEFLLDNGVNQNFSTSMMHMKETSGKNPTQRMEWYEYTCRQMAYDRDMFDIVEIIDALNGRLFPGVKPRQREPRLRRPPRSPEPSDATSEDSGDDFSSLTSAEDSDVSGEGQSSVDGEGGSRRMSGGDRRDVTRGSSGDASADTQGSGVKRTKRRMRATSGRSEGTLDGSEGEGGLSGSLRQRLQSEENMDRDSGHHSDDPGAAERDARSTERKKKKKSKGKDEEAEGEKTDAAKGPGSVGSGDAQGDQGDGSKGTARSSEQSADGATVVNDEGYETMSPSPSCIIRNQQTTQPQTVRFQEPSIPVKATKASLVLRKSTDSHMYQKIQSKYNEARPLNWRKIRSVGSYATESRLWHQTVTSLPPTVKGAWTPPELAAAPAAPAATTATMTKTSTKSDQHVVDSAAFLREFTSGNTTKPKVMARRLSGTGGPEPDSPGQTTRPREMTPLQRRLSISSVGDDDTVVEGLIPKPKLMKPSQKRLSMPFTSGGVTVGQAEETQPIIKSRDNKSGAQTAADTNKLYPLKQKVPQPNYMKMTRSSFGKRKLEPNFTNVYGSLDFVHPSAGRVDERGMLRKSPTVPKTVAGVTFTSVTDLPFAPALSPKFTRSSRRRTFSGYSPGRPDSVDFMGDRQKAVRNIRNNSSVLQSPRLNRVAAKTR